MIIDSNHITTEKGKVFRRKADGLIYGNEIWLGYTYYIGGARLNEPHLEVPEDFEEIWDQEEVSDTEALNIITGRDNE